MTGTPGDSAAGLAILQNRLQVADAKDADYLIKRHLRPSPRILQGQALRDLANSAIDLSDGLISDLGHIVKASDCGARIDLALLPFSDALSRHVVPEQALRWALSGGEDYELCFTVPELNRGALDVALGHLGVPFTCIGQMTADIEGLCFIRDGEPVTLDWKGYDHFCHAIKMSRKSRLKMSNPWHLLAVGFGSGLSPIVPGTMGSLAAIPFWYLMTFFTPAALFAGGDAGGSVSASIFVIKRRKTWACTITAALSGTNLLVCGSRSWRCRPMTGSGLPPGL